VVDPEPSCGPVGAGALEELVDTGLPGRTVPPRADGDPEVVPVEDVAVDPSALAQRVRQPRRRLLAMAVPRGEVVVARRHDHLDVLGDELEVLEQDDDLGLGRYRRRDVEVIAGEHHDVERGRRAHDPVELRQGVVQVADQQDAGQLRAGSGVSVSMP